MVLLYTVYGIRYKPVNHKRALTAKPPPPPPGCRVVTHTRLSPWLRHVSVINIISVFADEVEHGPSTPSPLWLRINFFIFFLFLSLFWPAPHPTPPPGEFSAYIYHIY